MVKKLDSRPKRLNMEETYRFLLQIKIDGIESMCLCFQYNNVTEKLIGNVM